MRESTNLINTKTLIVVKEEKDKMNVPIIVAVNKDGKKITHHLMIKC
jgi:hypothetical protein